MGIKRNIDIDITKSLQLVTRDVWCSTSIPIRWRKLLAVRQNGFILGFPQ